MATLKVVYQQQWRLKHREAGFCYDCNNLAAEGRTRCLDCSSKAHASFKLRLKTDGEKLRQRQRTYRLAHLEHFRELNRQSINRCRSIKRSQGLCIWCSKPVSAKSTYCALCLYKHRQLPKNSEQAALISRVRRQGYLRDNKCLRCGAPLIEDEVRYCFACKCRNSKS